MCRSSEFLVIGAGVVGLSIARALALAGKTVIILDQNDYGTGASGTNLGQLSISDRDSGLESELVGESLSLYAHLQARRTLEFRQSGGLFTLDTLCAVERVAPLVDGKIKAGFPIQLLVGEEVLRQEPAIQGIAGAVYCPQEGQLNPFLVTACLYDEAVSLGVRFIKNLQVKELLIAEEEVIGVATLQGNFLAKETILATGAWTKALCSTIGLSVPIDYIRGSAMVTLPVPPLLHGPVVGGFCSEEDPGRTLYFGGVQESGGSIVISQANHQPQDFNTNVDYNDLCGMARSFLSHYPMLHPFPIVRSWSGITPVSPDGKALWGRSTKFGRLFFAVAFKGAFSVAPAVGVRTARWLCDTSMENDWRQWGPGRFAL